MISCMVTGEKMPRTAGGDALVDGGTGTAPLRVLYLGGMGRSGSTLLERMLGEVPGACSLGDLD